MTKNGKQFLENVKRLLDKIFTKYDCVLIIDDLNFDLNRLDQSKSLIHICVLINLKS